MAISLSASESCFAASRTATAPVDEEAADSLVAMILNEHELSLEAEKAAYINWMRHHAARLVFSDRCRRLIEGLVPRLLEADVLPGRSVRKIFQEIEASDNCRFRESPQFP